MGKVISSLSEMILNLKPGGNQLAKKETQKQRKKYLTKS